MGYLLSIVVPTKDRYPYLKKLIELIKSFNSNEIELVIQDNTDDNREILEFINAINFHNLNYNYTQGQIPISQNADNAILNSCGEYVCFIGDDDGVTRHIVDCVKWMKSNDIAILRSQYSLYKWPSYINGRVMKLASTISYTQCSGEWHKIDTKEALKNTLNDGARTLKNMPKVYNGIVSRKALDRIYEKTGSFFPGPSPDMANAVALCLVESSYVYLDFPIIIGGQCASVGGGSRQVKGGFKKLSDVPFLPSNIEEIWNPKLPKIWSAETIWPESAIEALDKMGRADLISEVKIDIIHAFFSINRPDLSYMAFELTDNAPRLKALIRKMKRSTYFQAIKDSLNYVINNKTAEGLTIHRGVNNIIEAENVICKSYPTFDLKS